MSTQELFARLAAPFQESELECRILNAGIGSNGPWASIAYYVDARAVQSRLDQVLGPENWQVHYERSPDHRGFLCTLSVSVDGKWVSKSDGAEDTDTEPFKGGISSALRRAASVWGVGRYLYDRPSEWAQFVDAHAPGARKLKIKDQFFYWVPPSEQPKPTPKPAPTPKPQSVPAPQQQQPVGSPSGLVGDFVITFGRYNGKRLRDVTNEELKKHVEWLRGESTKKGESLKGKFAAYAQAVDQYLAQSQPLLGSDEMTEDDIPF